MSRWSYWTNVTTEPDVEEPVDVLLQWGACPHCLTVMQIYFHDSISISLPLSLLWDPSCSCDSVFMLSQYTVYIHRASRFTEPAPADVSCSFPQTDSYSWCWQFNHLWTVIHVSCAFLCTSKCLNLVLFKSVNQFTERKHHSASEGVVNDPSDVIRVI